MFRDNTVFIIGAGASAEFGLPVGAGLMQKIELYSLFRFDHGSLKDGVRSIYEALIEQYEFGDELNQRLYAMDEIRRSISFAGSIDEFINRHAEDRVIAEAGKLQIAHAIAGAEKNSIMNQKGKTNDGMPWSELNDTWVMTFTRMLFDGVRNSDVDTVGNNITLIVFNYDRCIEHFLERAIVKTFRGVDLDNARKIVGRINIIHPYGKLGDLTAYPFGRDSNASNLRSMSSNIVTWSESVDSEMSTKISFSISTASTMVFLGFAFAPQNMELLTVNSIVDRDRQEVETFATAYGYDPVIDKRLRAKIIDLYSSKNPKYNLDRVHIQYEMKCADFLKAHSMALVV